MPTEPDKLQVRGAESKHSPHADPAGHRTPSGSTYGDWVPESEQARTHANDDLDSDPIVRDFQVGQRDPMRIPPEPGSPRPRSDEGQSGSMQTGVLGEPQPEKKPKEPKPQPDESAAVESNRNKSFDTTHVHSGTTTRKV